MPKLPKNKVKTLLKPSIKPMQGRGEQTKEHYPQYHTRRWRAIREQQKERQPYCEECLKQGKYVDMVVCDHKITVKEMEAKGFDFWEASEPNNLQSLCTPCHNRKSATEK